MYNNMLFGLKRRIIDEVEGAFLKHPAYTDKVTVTNKFPYTERLQYGVVLRNSSASQIRMSADNYLAELWSHARMARTGNYPGIALEWVREDAPHITEVVRDEDVSWQLGPTQRRFFTEYHICKARGDTHFAEYASQVLVKINGVKVTPEFVNGKERVVMLKEAPSAGDVVTISYYKRKIASPGVYLIHFSADNQFWVTPSGIIRGEVVIDVTTGTESTATLLNGNIFTGTDDLYLTTLSDEAPQALVRNVDYSIDYATGEITLLQPLPSRMRLTADYRYDPDVEMGPYTVAPYQEVHNAIPGVVLCVGRRAKVGDRNIVIVSQFREEQARIYGGHWEMSISLGVISKDPMQMEEMTDQIVNHLWGIRKNVLEFEGITLLRVEPTGESEEVYIESTQDLYYESSVDISVQTEWQEFVPYQYDISKIMVEAVLEESNKSKDYEVFEDGSMQEKPVEVDTRPVIKYGTTSYERVI